MNAALGLRLAITESGCRPRENESNTFFRGKFGYFFRKTLANPMDYRTAPFRLLPIDVFSYTIRWLI